MGPHRRSSHDSGGDSSNTANSPDDIEGNAKFDTVNGPWPCGIPKGTACLYSNGGNSEHIIITKEDLKASEAVKIVCSNEQCPVSPFLHFACFTSFEETVLVYLKSQGRARGWSDKQRIQNLWTKRGYDLVYKACECSCGHGYVRKDLDWNPPVRQAVAADGGGGAFNPNAAEEVNGAKRKRKKSKSHSKGQTITIGLPAFANGAVLQQQHQEQQPIVTNTNNNNLSLASLVCSNPTSTTTQNETSKITMATATCNIAQTTASTSIPTYHQVRIPISVELRTKPFSL